MAAPPKITQQGCVSRWRGPVEPVFYFFCKNQTNYVLGVSRKAKPFGGRGTWELGAEGMCESEWL